MSEKAKQRGKSDEGVSYELRLADGSSWTIGADNDASERLRDYAKVLGLEESRDEAERNLLLSGSEASRVMSDESRWDVKNLRLLRFFYHESRNSIVCDIGPNESQMEEWLKLGYSLFPIFEAVQEQGGIPFQAALIERDGEGILIAAMTGTGKTSICKNVPFPWKALSDDETLVVKAGTGYYRAHPFPTWSRYVEGEGGETWDVQRSVHVRAIFFLEQAKGAEEVLPLKPWEAAVRANQLQSPILNCAMLGLAEEQWRKLRTDFYRSIADFVLDVPAYVLRARLDGNIWETIGQVLA